MQGDHPGGERAASVTIPEKVRHHRSLRVRLLEFLGASAQAVLEMSNRLQLPAPTVLPVAGAVVGLYSGLAAGLFTNLIWLVNSIFFSVDGLTLPSGEKPTLGQVTEALASSRWHTEYAIMGVPLALLALVLSRVIWPGGPRDQVKNRLRVLALLVLGALSLYYPLLLVANLNMALGGHRELSRQLVDLPWWVRLPAPMLGGLLVGWMLRKRPEIHGHGVPEVVMAVRREREPLRTRGGVLKLLASAVTIGSGGSAGREGPIVYVGAALASGVGRTLGFTRKELSILLASGAGAGIAASFDAPITGAIFAMEIILREFEIKVFSPIILASVTATMVGRGLMGAAPMLHRMGYQMASGWEILAYVALGLLSGLLAFAFVRLLHHAEELFSGRLDFSLSKRLGQWPLPARAGLGGLLVGGMILLSPAVWGAGHEWVNIAVAGNLSITALLAACVLKLLATSTTIGSGGSGGTFFPMVVMGALAGGAFGGVVHALFPNISAPGGAYAAVGLGATVAGFNRAPLTGMMIAYELSGNYAIILPLMVTCTIASALCHYLVERRSERPLTDESILRRTPVRALVVPASPVPAATRLRELLDLLLGSSHGALPVLDPGGRVYGIVQLHHLRELWRDEQLTSMLNAVDAARKLPTLTGETDLATALDQMDQNDVDALPVVDFDSSVAAFGLVTRIGIQRFLHGAQAEAHAEARRPVASTELEAAPK